MAGEGDATVIDENVNHFQNNYYLRTIVTAIERSSKKDPIFRFDAHTNLPKFRTTQFRDVRRTHHEFEKLADHYVISNPECMVPVLPPSVTTYGAGTDEDDRRVKQNIQRWLNLICANPVLMRDDETIHFVESDFGWSPVMSKGKPATGIRRRAIKQFTPPADDCAELLNARPIAKQFYLLSSSAATRLDKVIRARRSLSTAEGESGQKLGNMSAGESHAGMCNAFMKLGRTLQAVSDAHSAHATLEAATLGDALSYHAIDAFNVKETLTTRHILMRELVAAQNLSRTKTSTVTRMKSAANINSGKVDEALASLEEAKRAEQTINSKLARVTANLLIENRAWQKRIAHEMKAAIAEYTRKQIDSERRVLAILESVRPDIRTIDQSGGLSRLGRESIVRRGSYMGPSQTLNGDAWSGVPRRNSIKNGIVTDSRPPGERMKGITDITENDDRVDAKNAASILAGGL